MESYIQESPFAVQIEFTEGCSLYCDFCGLHGIREGVGDYKFATPETIQRIADEIKRLSWNPRIEIAMRGEPSMNPKFIELVAILRKTLPKHQLMMTSNGSGYIKAGNIQKVFAAGLDILALDKYADVDFVERALKNNGLDEQYLQSFSIEGKYRVPIYQYPAQPDGNPHRRIKGKMLTVIHDIATNSKGTHAKLLNHCGAAAPLNYSKEGKRCAKPFRELSIHYNGAIAICCNDWRGTYACGNINATPLEEIWQGKPFTLARKALYNGQRTFKPCLGCNATSYRAGFLPDKKGKETLDIPTEVEWVEIHKIAEAPALTPIVWREWEKQK
jgi:radical SAM protein with 4Fe4S-binding SPASM domain